MSAGACGGPSCLVSQLSSAVRTLSSDVLVLHETVRKLQPDTRAVRLQRLVWTVAGALLSVATSFWLYEWVSRRWL